MRNYSKYSLAVIPARGGSKRIPHKNIKEFFGMPIIAYTIKAAINSGMFSRIIVSTDDKRIADVAELYGAEIPFLRQENLADEFTPVSLATVDALNKLDPDGTTYKYIAQLMPNCPLRSEEDIRNSFTSFFKSGADSQISVTRYGWLNPWWALTPDDKRRLIPIHSEFINSRSQDLPEIFCPTGAIWWAKTDVLRREKTFHIPDRIGWEIPWQRAIDIDDDGDWKFAEMLWIYNEHS